MACCLNFIQFLCFSTLVSRCFYLLAKIVSLCTFGYDECMPHEQFFFLFSFSFFFFFWGGGKLPKKWFTFPSDFFPILCFAMVFELQWFEMRPLVCTPHAFLPPPITHQNVTPWLVYPPHGCHPTPMEVTPPLRCTVAAMYIFGLCGQISFIFLISFETEKRDEWQRAFSRKWLPQLVHVLHLISPCLICKQEMMRMKANGKLAKRKGVRDQGAHETRLLSLRLIRPSLSSQFREQSPMFVFLFFSSLFVWFI